MPILKELFPMFNNTRVVNSKRMRFETVRPADSGTFNMNTKNAMKF